MPEHSPVPTPSRAIYGFAMFLSSELFFIFYIICAIVPDSWFRAIGITCIPQRYWFVTLPVIIVSGTLIFWILIYPSLCLLLTPNIDDLSTIRDDHANHNDDDSSQDIFEVHDCCCIDKSKCKKEEFEKIYKNSNVNRVPTLRDLKVWDVSDYLYLK